jgi:hypothetical protein
MRKSLIVFKNIDELDSVHSKLESMKSLLIVFALILCMAKVAKFFASFFVMKKIKLVHKNVSRIVTECDKPVSKRRATLVSLRATPTRCRYLSTHQVINSNSG